MRTAATPSGGEAPSARRRTEQPTPASVSFALAAEHDPSELQAQRFGERSTWTGPVAASSVFPLPHDRAAAVDRALSAGGEPLDTTSRASFESELGLDLNAVRIHTNAEAAASNRELHTKAYTVGNHIVFSSGAYAPATGTGREVLGHELAHVAQQAATGTPVVAAMPDLGFWDVVELASPGAVGGVVKYARELDVSPFALLEYGGRAVLGDTVFDVLQSFMGGFEEGLVKAPESQLESIRKKYSEVGLAELWTFLQGFGLGILEGLWHGLKGLVEGVIALVRLPFAIGEFLDRLPLLAAKYTVRLYSLGARGGPLQTALARLRAAWAADPAGMVAQVDRLLVEVRLVALAYVRERGRGAAKDVLDFLVKPWKAIGEQLGDVAGQVLFQVVLAVATEAIANLVAKAGELVALLARGVARALEGIGKLLGEALSWIEGLIARMAGAAGELLEALGGALRELRDVLVEIEANPEVQAAERSGAGEAGEATALTPKAEPLAAEAPPAAETPAVVEPTGDEIWDELAEELGATPATRQPSWNFPGTWRRAKRFAYKAIFGESTLPEVNRVGRVRMTLGHIVEKSTGGQHALENLMPQLNEVNVELSGIYAREPFALRLPDGTLKTIPEINGKAITGSLREAFQSGRFTLEEQRAISFWITGTVITPAREAELASLIAKIPKLAPLVR